MLQLQYELCMVCSACSPINGAQRLKTMVHSFFRAKSAIFDQQVGYFQWSGAVKDWAMGMGQPWAMRKNLSTHHNSTQCD
jgi:hypothetical protein